MAKINQSTNDDLLIRYLTDEVSGEEKAQVEQWCAASDENREVLEQLYFALQASNCLRIMKSVDRNKALGRLKNRIRQKERASHRRLMVQRCQRVAAVLLLPVLLLSGWLLLQKNEIRVQYVEVHSNPGMVASFDLPDGSKVWLNGGSRLRYPNVFNGKSREVQISGQGYFEIVHNSRQPFSVKTGESFSLEVLGTSFNVSAYDDEDVIETTLVEGSVRLNLLQDDKMVQHTMQPNGKVIYSKDAQSVKVAAVDPQYDIAWKDHRIMFKNHPMEQVIRILGRYYNVQFVVKNGKVMDSEITGKFSNEQLPQVMEYLRIASGIKYSITPATVGDSGMNPEIVEIWK